ncbi:unnamed protein product, partial [Mesorhabditis belari]|uniref:G protein-coupled receptor n=1 Tax=Mesorhabditis belari TaxID=2138241 RepID=A0AAF3J2C8_9BILA
MENIVPFIDTTREVSIDTNTAVFHVLHYIAIFEAAINLFGFYVIAFHTPQSMRNYGRALSAYQIVSLIADGLIGSALAPYLIFPVPGGLPMDLWLCLSGSYGNAHGYNVHCSTSNDFAARTCAQIETRRFPILRQFLLIDRFYAFSLENGMNVCINVTIWVFIVVIIISVVVLSCFHVLESRKNKISPKTFRLQRKWIHKCILQVSIPMITLLFPVLASIYIFVSQNLALVGIFAPRTFAMGEATTVVPGGSDRRFSLAARMAKTSFTRTSVVQSTF